MSKKPYHPNARHQLIFGILAIVIVLLSFALHLRWNPRLVEIYPDSGLFMYGAQEILSGRLLYVDIWDHKPPAVFYTNALAMLILGKNPWAIWWLGLIWITLTVIVFQILMSKLTDRLSAFIGSLLFLFTLMHPIYYQGGNFTEIYALLPQVLNVLAAFSYFSSGHSRWAFLAGTLTALAFLYKPTYIGIGIATIIVIFIWDLRQQSRSRAIRNLLCFTGGVSIILGVVVVYWGVKGALPELLDAAILFNLSYTKLGFPLERFRETFTKLTQEQPIATLFTIAMAGLFIFITQFILRLTSRSPRTNLPFSNNYPLDANQKSNLGIWAFTTIFMAMPFEFFFLFLSGRAFGHYYITPIPIMAMGSIYFLSEVRYSWRNISRLKLVPIVYVIFLVYVLIPWGKEVAQNVLPRKQHFTDQAFPLYGSYNLNPLHDYVLEHSNPSDFVLVWHIHPSINFLTDRPAPSRYLYPLHLFYPGRGTKSRFDQFFENLEANPPVLILTQEVSSAGIPFFGAEGDKLCPYCSPESREGMLKLKAYVEKDYSYVKTIGDWIIYERNP